MEETPPTPPPQQGAPMPSPAGGGPRAGDTMMGTSAVGRADLCMRSFHVLVCINLQRQEVRVSVRTLSPRGEAAIPPTPSLRGEG